MRSLEQLDRWIASRVKGWASKVTSSPANPGLLEIRREILERVRDRIEPLGEGRSVFPYNHVAVRIAASSSSDRDLYEAAFAGENGLEQDIRALLTEGKASVPLNFSVAVETIDDSALPPGEPPVRVDCVSQKIASTPRTRPQAALKVVKGEADPEEMVIASDRVNLGRLKEVIGSKDGLRRRNDIAFADEETTVSREHASIRYDAGEDTFRLYDSNSQRGTSVFRNGRRMEVTPGARGFQLKSGDEIHLGEVRLRFELL
jgi:hypothetical protein